LHFDSDGRGGNIVIFAGAARIDEQAPSTLEVGAYLEKYHKHIARIKMTPESFARAYSAAIRVTPTGCAASRTPGAYGG
jgi:PPOX class probable F420-dependent enzyme